MQIPEHTDEIRQQLREQAVANVNERYRYSMPLHSLAGEYTAEEDRLTTERVIAAELAFAAYLRDLDTWPDDAGPMAACYNNVDLACQWVMSEVSKEDRERIRLAMVEVREAHHALNKRATLYKGIQDGVARQAIQRELIERIMQALELTPQTKGT
jgi:hypothetical protein